MFSRATARRFFITGLLMLVCSMLVIGQINQLPPPPLSDPELLADIFKATRRLQEHFRAVEFKERIAFRLAAVVNENRANQNIDYRQSADYLVTIKPDQAIEKKFLQTNHGPRFGVQTVLKNFDLSNLQESLPQVASLQMALLGFINSDYINGYKEVGHDNIRKHRAIKLALRFRPGRLEIERCLLWIDEKTHQPLRAELKIGDIGRFSDVLLMINYDLVGDNGLPSRIEQEMNCSSYERGIPIRLEHISTYTELRSLAGSPATIQPEQQPAAPEQPAK